MLVISVLTRWRQPGRFTRTSLLAPIVGYENPMLRCRERQNFVVRHCGIRLSGIQRCQDVVPQPAQFRDDLRRTILVRVERAIFYAVSFSRICASISAEREPA